MNWWITCMPDRRRTRSEERIDEQEISPTALLTRIETLSAERDAATTVAEEYLAALQRERAEFLNFKRRTAEERDREFGLAGEDLIRKVLHVADDFDRAIDLLKAMPEDDRHRAAVYMEGLAEMRKEFTRGPDRA